MFSCIEMKHRSNAQFLKNAFKFILPLLIFPLHAYAASNEEVIQEVNQLKQRVESVERKLEKTENQLADTQRELVDAQSGAKQGSQMNFSKITGAPRIVSSDGKSSIALFGRINMDIAFIPEQNVSGSTKDEDFVESHTATEIRRARLGVEGRFYYDWKYELEIDVAENDLDLKKAHISYSGWKNNDLKIGFQRVAFGLENTASSRYTLFMERSLTDTFSPDRDFGIAWHQSRDWWQFKIGVYVPNSIEELDTGAGHRADATTYIGRITIAPVDKSNQVVHLGASIAYSDYSDKEDIRFRTTPESHLSSRLVSTAKILDPDYAERLGFEAGYSSSGFLLQSEYSVVSTKGHYDDIAADIDTYEYAAWYLSGAYMLTGEPHVYRAKSGTFGNVFPDDPLSKGGLGAWELAFRFSNINLNDNGEKGGRMDDITLALNWYMENNLKFMVNYIHYKADDYREKNRVDKQEDNIIQTRLQWFF
jgi:phosphate-selective porin OprO/OprP